MITAYENALENPGDIIRRSQHLFSTHLDGSERVCDGSVLEPPMVTDPDLLGLKDLMYELGQKAAKERGLGKVSMESVQYIKYKKNEGYFKKHSDGMGRVMSGILYLNTVEEGGTTVFYFSDFTYVVKPQAGKAIFFSADDDHEATIPLSEDKHVLVTWYRSES